MTPVEATNTFSTSIFKVSAAHCASNFAFSISFGLHAFAFPELTITAWLNPFDKCSFVTRIGAAFTLFFVYTAAV